jgi:trimethylamine--corrinoid protein Co-methyltransferase
MHWGLQHVTNGNVFRNRDGTREVKIGDGQIRAHNSGGPPFIFDLESGQRRPATLQDCAEMTRLLDALPNVDVIWPFFSPQDVTPELVSILETEMMLRNTSKPATAGTAEGPEAARYKVELAAACCGGLQAFRRHPTLSLSVSPISPLTFTEKVTGAIMTTVEMGATFQSLPCPSLGATSPITLAGALAQQHAEVLASFLIAAATRPGAPVIYSNRIGPIDMRTALRRDGPEVGISGACAAQLAHRLGLVCDVYGLTTSSCTLDPQLAYERFANAFVPALAGADILSGVGSMDNVLSGAYEVALMDDDIIGLLKHIVRGCPVNQATIALDVMKEVIGGDGVFLGHVHTVQQMRQGALWTPRLTQRAAEILRTHQVEPLPDAVSLHVNEIVEHARRDLIPG